MGPSPLATPTEPKKRIAKRTNLKRKREEIHSKPLGQYIPIPVSSPGSRALSSDDIPPSQVLLTDHQREVLQRQRNDAPAMALYNNLDRGASQDVPIVVKEEEKEEEDIVVVEEDDSVAELREPQKKKIKVIPVEEEEKEADRMAEKPVKQGGSTEDPMKRLSSLVEENWEGCTPQEIVQAQSLAVSLLMVLNQKLQKK